MVSNLPAIREEIERRGGNDAQALRCMIDEVQALMDHHGTLAKGFLGNFIPLLERNPWVSEALTRAILAWAMNT